MGDPALTGPPRTRAEAIHRYKARQERIRDVLREQLEPDEELLAEGRALGNYLFVTSRRILWLENENTRHAGALAFESMTGFREEYEAHRYYLTIQHGPLRRFTWVPRHNVLWFHWGNSEAWVTHTRSTFGFSHDQTKAAKAIRSRLEHAGIERDGPPSRRTPRKPRGRGGLLRAQPPMSRMARKLAALHNVSPIRILLEEAKGRRQVRGHEAEEPARIRALRRRARRR